MPFAQGKFAHSIGRGIQDCPYDPNSLNGALWLDGWTKWAFL